MKIDLRIRDDKDLPAFAGFVAGSTEGEVEIRVNIPATLIVSAEERIDFYELLAENTVHEILHAFQELYHKAFNEEEVEEAILQAREYVSRECGKNDPTVS